jgi:predicted nucleic acid-binding protein
MARPAAVAYVDTSWLVAIALGERDAGPLARRLQRYDRLLASNLLEAELRSALAREQAAAAAEPLLSWIGWVLPDRPLSGELRRVAAAGGLRGAAMWHLAHALYLAPEGKDLDFLTLDHRQQDAASALGFPRVAAPSSRRA